MDGDNKDAAHGMSADATGEGVPVTPQPETPVGQKPEIDIQLQEADVTVDQVTIQADSVDKIDPARPSDLETISNPSHFALAAEESNSHTKWLAEQVAGYSIWYGKGSGRYASLSRIFQICAAVTGLVATVMAAAPESFNNVALAGVPWRWIIAILTAVTTVLSGTVPNLIRLATEREEGRIQMVRLRQELDILQGKPTQSTYLAAIAVLNRIALIERRYGGVGKVK